MTIEDLRARYARLEQLSMGLAREAQLFSVASKINDPLLYLERNGYRHAMQDALAGVEKARVTLAKAIHRLEFMATDVGAWQDFVEGTPSFGGSTAGFRKELVRYFRPK